MNISKKIKSILKKKPTNSVAHAFSRGNQLLKSKQFDNAISTYKQAIDKSKDHFEAYKNMGNAYMALGQTKEAIKAYQHAISINPDYYEANLNIGNAFLASGETEKALTAYQQTLKINAECYDSWSGIGNAYMQINKPQDALEPYNKAFHIEPNNPKILYNLGLCLLLNKNSQKALHKLSKALKIINTNYSSIQAKELPFLYDLHKNRGFAFSNLAQYAEAIRCYEEILPSNNDAQLYLLLGNAHLNLGDYDAALSALQIAHEFNPIPV